MKTSTTPSPWEAVFDEKAIDGTPYGIVVGGCGENGGMDTVICYGPDYREDRKSFKAFKEGNASLIAAAPDLL